MGLAHKCSSGILIVGFVLLLLPESLGKDIFGFLFRDVFRQRTVFQLIIFHKAMHLGLLGFFSLSLRAGSTSQKTLAFKLGFVVSCHCNRGAHKSLYVLYFVINLSFCPAIVQL